MSDEVTYTNYRRPKVRMVMTGNVAQFEIRKWRSKYWKKCDVMAFSGTMSLSGNVVQCDFSNFTYKEHQHG